jgi:hypothetical protein
VTPRATRAQRSRLAATAHEYQNAGWPVAPGAWWSSQQQRYRCGRPGCRTSGPHPVDLAPDAPSGRCRVLAARSAQAVAPDLASCWTHRPYALLLPTGGKLTVIDGAHEIVAELDEKLRQQGHFSPLATPVTGQLQLFCAALDADLELWLAAAAASVLVHSDDSWVPLPPSSIRTGLIRWVRSPQAVGWQVAPASVATTALRSVLSSGHHTVLTGPSE